MYFNAIFTSFIAKNRDNKYSVGASFLYDRYRSVFSDSLAHTTAFPFYQTIGNQFFEKNKEEVVPGVFAELTYTPFSKLTAVFGLRGDYNFFYNKVLITPRANVKYDVNQHFTARFSVGRGYRSPNALAENIGVLASSRRLVMDNLSDIQMESAWNYGGNLQFHFPIWKGEEASISIDYFHTKFDNQLITDLERNAGEVYFYNLRGKSFADVLQADLSFTAFRGFDVYAAFRWNNTQIAYQTAAGEILQREKPLTSRFRGLVNLSYATKLRKWVFDFTAQINGPSRLPSLQGYGAAAAYSPVYPVLFAQITKNTKRFDVYLGAENLLDYRQKDAIVDWQHPFGSDFDAFSQVWGPLMGRRIYIGARIRIGEIK